MLFSTSLTFVAFAASACAQASSFPSLNPRAACPAVWTKISADLTKIFVGGFQCTDDARAAIRAVFHDCFPQGGCDGSLAIPEELSRPENVPMTATVNKLKALAQKYSVGVADMLMFAGSHAVISCPGGPTTKTYIGRVDATHAAPTGQLPAANVSAAEALSHFQAAGFSAQDLGALIGSHTAARQFNTDPQKVGAPEDSTPGIWDVLYYAQTILKLAPFTFVSDSNLAKSTTVGPFMKKFALDKRAWDAAFAPAMAKLEVLGNVGPSGMTDCTSALPHSFDKRSGTTSYARQILNSMSQVMK